MLDPTNLSTAEIKLRRKKLLEDFNHEINGYASDLIKVIETRNLKPDDLKEILKEIDSIEEMRKLFYSEVKILKRRKSAKKPIKKAGLFGISFAKR